MFLLFGIFFETLSMKVLTIIESHQVFILTCPQDIIVSENLVSLMMIHLMPNVEGDMLSTY